MTSALPPWKSALAALVVASPESAAADIRTALGLQFELREQTPRSPQRWNGPTAKKTTEKIPGIVSHLGVRPVVSVNGRWTKSSVSWSTVNFQLHRLNLDDHQYRWFCQFPALQRAGREVYLGQDGDWLYLDDFASPLLWHLLDEAQRIGIEFVGSSRGSSVVLHQRATISFDARRNLDDLVLTPTVTVDGTPFTAPAAGLTGDHGVYVVGTEPSSITLAPTGSPVSGEQRELLSRESEIVVPAEDADEFLTVFYPALSRSVPFTSLDGSVEFPEAPPALLVLTARFGARESLELGWHVEYADGERISVEDGSPFDPRVLAAISATLGRFSAVGPSDHPMTLRGFDTIEFTAKVLALLERVRGMRVDVDGERPEWRELTETPTLTLRTVESDQRDWFDLGVIVKVDGRSIPFQSIFTALARGQKKLKLVDRSYLSLDQPIFDRLRVLIEEAKSLAEWDTGLRISRYQVSLWSEFEDLADDTEQAASWRACVGGLLDSGGVQPTAPPAGLAATLRPYQQEGFDWLAFLYTHRLGGILADDMGLGKTVQALALMAHAVETADPDARRPFLVVAPTSVVPNWVGEAARFTPGLRVSTDRTDFDAADIIVTSYALFRRNFASYTSTAWAGLILDEAQFVKNPASRVHQCALELDADFTLAITGTPIENNLGELWALFALVAPGLFPSRRKFADTYQRPVEVRESAERLATLRRRIRPFLLRRTKDLVAPELPPKQEQILSVTLAPSHRTLYDTVLQRERQKLFGLIDDIDKNRFIVFRSITLLRMLALDASLIDPAHAAIPSAKLDLLFEQLEEVIAEGHRTIVFSQFTSFLTKVAGRLDSQGTPYCYLDGSSRNRAQIIDGFTEGEAPVFLISLKAGGFGLNLTEADYVFLLDPWWNPASETQAIDRTHRIGQSKNVMVYRMVAADTIEEKVMALKEKKAALFDAVLDDDDTFSARLTGDDIRTLLE